MCDGFSEALFIGGMIASAAAQTTSSIMEYRADSAQKKTEANIAEANAKIAADQANVANTQAELAQEAGAREAEQRSRQLAADIGSAYSNWAGNGLLVDGSGGTFGNILKTTTTEGAEDINTINRNTAAKVWEYQENARAYTNQSNIYNTQASYARKTANNYGKLAAGLTSAAGSLMSSGATGAKNYNWFTSDYDGLFSTKKKQ